MTHKAGSLRAWSLAALFTLALAACGDSGGDSGAGTSAEAGKTAPAGTPAATSASKLGAPKDFAGVVTPGEVNDQGYVLGPVSLGNPDAPVTVIEYASYTCPHCAEFDENVVARLKPTYIDSGQVRFEFRNFIRDRYDLAVAMLVRCEGADRFFPLSDLFFARQREWLANARQPERIIDDIAAVARRAGISRTRFDQCLADRDLQQHLIEMTQEGQKAWDITGTPTIIVNGEKQTDVKAFTYEGMVEIIEDEL